MVDFLDGVNVAVPDGATAAMSTVDNDIRDFKNRLINSFGLEHTLTGEHKIPRGNTASRPVSPQTDQIYINTQTGMIEYYDGAVWQDAITLATAAVPAGAKMWFYNNAAPSGWTFDSSLNDRVLSVTSTVGDGGATTGAWTISGLTSAIGGAAGAHTPGVSLGTISVGGGVGTAVSNVTMQAVGTHTHAAGAISADGAWRPASARGIVCTKD